MAEYNLKTKLSGAWNIIESSKQLSGSNFKSEKDAELDDKSVAILIKSSSKDYAETFGAQH